LPKWPKQVFTFPRENYGKKKEEEKKTQLEHNQQGMFFALSPPSCSL